MPLFFVLGITALKDGLEDRRRHIADRAENDRITRVYSREEQQFLPTHWKDVRVGDIIKTKNRELVCADMVLFASSNPNGAVHIMTANLDGETNLKQRTVHADMHLGSGIDSSGGGPVVQESLYAEIEGYIECDLPNKKLTQFCGVFFGDASPVSLSIQNTILRGVQVYLLILPRASINSAVAVTKHRLGHRLGRLYWRTDQDSNEQR